MFEKIKKHSHILLLSLVILLINLWPSFFTIPGTYFLLDTGFTPFAQWRGLFEASFYWHLIDLGTFLFGYALWSKIFFISVLGVGIYMGLLLSKYVGNLFPKFRGKMLDIVAILVTIYNPFIYERIISQTGIALGTYCIGIGILLLLIENKRVLFPALYFGTAWMIFPHSILFILLILVVFTLLHYKNILRYCLILIGVIILNANWLIGDYILGVNSGASKLETFNRTNIEVFQGNNLSGLGVDITHLLGYGFWGERYHITSPDDIIPFWYIFGFLVLVLVVYGLYTLYKKQKKSVLILISIGVISYILALGIASPLWGGFNSWLYENISFYIGMREPQKWLGITQIVYMVGLCIGIMGCIVYFQKYKYIKHIVYVIVVLPILWTPASLIGYWGQLNISDYPEDIFTAKDFIEENIPKNKKILNFPWHSYMGCEWMYGKITSNRSKQLFYPADIISADNIEIAHLYTNSSNPLSKDIDTYLKTKDIQLLKKNGIQYILFSATCADRENYVFLNDDIYTFTKILDTDHIDIYKINYEK